MSSESSYPFQHPLMPWLLSEADIGRYLNIPDSLEGKAWAGHLEPTEADRWKLLGRRVQDAWGVCEALVKKAYEKLPELNDQIQKFDELVKVGRTAYEAAKKKAEARVKPLFKKRQVAKATAEAAKRRAVKARAALQLKQELTQRIRQAKDSLTLTKPYEFTIWDKVIEWIVRVVVGIALALSLGLIIGALNQYKPWSAPLAIFWAIGTTILITAGISVTWLARKASETAELKRHPRATVSRGNKWFWTMLGMIAFMSGVGATVLMYGAFRLLQVFSFTETQAGTSSPVPLSIIYLACFIFEFPYLCMEASYGWERGEKKVKELELETLIEDEQKMEGVTLETLSQETAEVAELEVEAEQAQRELGEVEAEIQRIRTEVEKPVFRPPTQYGIGLFNGNGPDAEARYLLTLVEPPINEDLVLARKQFIKALDEFEVYDKELAARVEARTSQPREPKGFFARWLRRTES